jgi:hypothetical protein
LICTDQTTLFSLLKSRSASDHSLKLEKNQKTLKFTSIFWKMRATLKHKSAQKEDARGLLREIKGSIRLRMMPTLISWMAQGGVLIMRLSEKL